MIIEERDTPEVETTSLRGWMIWGTAALFYLYEFFVRVAPSAMEPELQAHFGLSAAALGAAAGTYYLVYSPMQLLSGTIIDRFGPRHVLLVSVLICTLGAFLEVAGSSSMLLVAARFCQGLGSAFAFVGTMYLAAEWFPHRMLALLAGLTTSLGMAGAIIGNSGIAAIVQSLGWQPALLIAGGVGLGITALIALVVPNRPPVELRAVTAKKPNVIKALKVVYANPQSWYIGIVGAALYMPLSILGALWGEEYISAVTGADKVGAAGAVSMMYVGWLIGGPIAGYVSDRFKIRRGLLMGASLATLIVTIVIALLPSASLPTMYVLLLLLGFASTSEVVCFAAAVEHNPPNVMGTAIASTNMIIMLLGGIAEWGFGALLDAFSGGADVPSTAAFRMAIGLLPAISVVGFFAAMMLTEVRSHKEVAAALAA
ncbi:MFS transporter [Aquabacter spiritensis]|uniref:Lysosomal dipeptide transporter MFSD1 n=1 Tax=Aquabacter spiritensis TaxID=933073 RepID=A0A4R3M5L0_9HYPH|nr:MFS transporter [Aquabacter spiritensis]TCT07539.1 sugar phosphate permease [Aquabacter spiritensis]